MKINFAALGFTKIEKTVGKTLPRTYVTWKHANGIEVQGDDVSYGRPWTTGIRRADGRFEFLTGKEYKKKRYGATVKGAVRCFGTASKATEAALKEYAPDLLKSVAKKPTKADHKTTDQPGVMRCPT